MDKLLFTTPHSFMQRHVHPLFGQVKSLVDGYEYGWTGNKMKEQKTIDIVSDVSKVSVNGVTCSHFRSSDTFKICKLA